MTTTTTTEYEKVYEGICAVAARCDGAIQEDGVGFSGVDTVFGRRIAAVPFSAWTPDICAEAAKVVLTYKAQIERYLGFDVWELQVVKDAQGQRGTNYAARSQAREMAKRADRMPEVVHRKIALENEVYSVAWSRRDPDFAELLEAARSIPGRTWNPAGACWTAPISRELAEFARRFEFPTTGKVACSLKAIMCAPVAKVYNITLSGDHALISAPYDAARVQAARELPGRSWDGARKVDVVALDPQLLVFARLFGLSVSPEVEAAVANGPAPEVVDPLPGMFTLASRCADPAELPEAFVALVRAAIS